MLIQSELEGMALMSLYDLMSLKIKEFTAKGNNSEDFKELQKDITLLQKIINDKKVKSLNTH